MTAGFVGFVLGAAVPIALAEVGWMRRRQASAHAQQVRSADPIDWMSTMPPPRSSLRPRWESSSDPADEDDLIEFLVTVGAVVVLTAGIFFGSSTLAWFFTFVVCGAAFGAAGIGVFAWVVRRELPPGARQVVVRAGVVAVVAGLALHWFLRTRFRGLDFERVHNAVLKVKLTRRPGQVHTLFDADGVLLYVSLGVGVMLAVGLLITVLVDVMAMLAATRLGEGSRGAFNGWLAQLYPRRQLRLWVSSGIVGAVMILLVAGAVLGWYDRYEQNTHIEPATVPIVADPPGLVVPLTVPATVPTGRTVPVAPDTTLAAAETTAEPAAVPLDPATTTVAP